MKYGLLFANFGNYGDVHLLADLAQQAEEAGWSGVFLMDTLCFEDGPTCDPWIALAAMAMRTQRIALGLQVAALSRRRPWKLVREAVTLDHLSGGRLILGVGAGTAYDPGFAAFGEEMDAKKRAAMLDESLEILPGLWSGKPFSFQGEHYHIDPITFLPPPVQTPGIPLWIGGMELGKGLIERAARFDGVVPFPADGTYAKLTPEKIHQLKRLLDQQRTDSPPFTPAMDRLFLHMYPQIRQVRSRGIPAFGLNYWSAELGGIERVDREGKAVQYNFRYDPTDISRISLFRNEEWVGDDKARELQQADGTYRHISLAEWKMAKYLVGSEKSQAKRLQNWPWSVTSRHSRNSEWERKVQYTVTVPNKTSHRLS